MTTQPTDEKTHWVAVMAEDDLVDDEGVRIATTPAVSVYRSDGELFCIDDTCTHETYSLAEGWVENCVVECALHMAKFDLRTGAALCTPAFVPLRTHRTRVRDGHIEVELPISYDTALSTSISDVGAS
ncbi:bifunctional 3-phenylpropionate/cinnamic acid dioxygenase ferredoxin subunit [Streptomyces umbrinus]|uniref:bifunctional 3-phenylpropionate/cinnamic acid dioxygenase ferredoxin subunit n=1 Tax=Streptomyces umbrinus TaxID=67370 RepID=UPI0033D22F16